MLLLWHLALNSIISIPIIIYLVTAPDFISFRLASWTRPANVTLTDQWKLSFPFKVTTFPLKVTQQSSHKHLNLTESHNSLKYATSAIKFWVLP